MRFAIFGHHAVTATCIRHLLGRGHGVRLFVPNACRGEAMAAGLHPPDIPIEFFEDISEASLHDAVAGFAPDYLLTIVFGSRIPSSLSGLATRKALNFHPAPLPEFRTANAWFWPLRQGARSSSICVHELTEVWDAGGIVLRKDFPLHPRETQGTYIEKIERLGDAVMGELLARMETGPLEAVAQPTKGRYYGRLRLRDIAIDWNEPADTIDALVRACNPFHLAQTVWRDALLLIAQVEPAAGSSPGPGVLSCDESGMFVGCGDGRLRLQVVEVPGRGVLAARHWRDLYAIADAERLLGIGQLPQLEAYLEQRLQ